MGIVPVTVNWVYFDLVWDISVPAFWLMDVETGDALKENGEVMHFMSWEEAVMYIEAEDMRASIRNVLGGP